MDGSRRCLNDRPKASTKPVCRRVADAHGEQGSLAEARLRSFCCGNVVAVHLVLAGLNVDDQHFAPVLRLVHGGAYLLLVQRLPTLYNLTFGIAGGWHGFVPSGLWSEF
jgi:hypothetical protein